MCEHMKHQTRHISDIFWSSYKEKRVSRHCNLFVLFPQSFWEDVLSVHKLPFRWKNMVIN